MGLDAICRFGCLNPGFACGIDGFKMAIQSVASVLNVDPLYQPWCHHLNADVQF